MLVMVLGNRCENFTKVKPINDNEDMFTIQEDFRLVD